MFEPRQAQALLDLVEIGQPPHLCFQDQLGSSLGALSADCPVPDFDLPYGLEGAQVGLAGLEDVLLRTWLHATFTIL